MKRYHLKLTAGDPINESKILSVDIIEADNLVQLLAQQLIVIAQLQIKIQERIDNHRIIDDDIPF